MARQAYFAEFIGTAALLATIIGSGIMGEQLAGGNVAIALLSNTFAGIAPASVLPFIAAQILGLGLALLVVPKLFADEQKV